MAHSASISDSVHLEPVDRLDDVREDWSRLADATGHPFATWEWNAGWWRWFGGGRDLCSFVCRDAEGEIVAILPLYVATTRPLRVARLLGNGDLQSPVCAPEHRPLAARALAAATRSPHGCRLLLAERLPHEHGWGELVGGTLVSSHHDPVLPFEGRTWEEVLASRSKNFREQVRRRERRLVRDHALAFRLSDDPDRLPADLEALFRLHASRWGGETTGVFSGPGADFHREFAAEALRRGWLRLWLAEIGGEPVAAWYGFRFGGSEWYYQAGRDVSYDQLSLGFVMLAHTVREACRDGADSYHFLAGAEEYKSRFAAEDPGAESRLLGSGPVARAAKLGISVGFALPPGVRRRVMRVARRGA